MPLQVPTNASSVILQVALLDAAGDRIASVAHNAAGLAFAYRVENQSTWTSVTLSDGTIGTWGSGTWKHDVSGMYQIGLPNAAISANKRTFLRLTYGAIAPQFDSIEATGVPSTVLDNIQNAGAGTGDNTVTVTVTSDTLGLLPGATVTIQNQDGNIVRWGRTGGSGSVAFNLDNDDYVLLVSAGAAFTSYTDDITVDGNETFDVELTASGIVEAAEVESATGTEVYRLRTATDWIIDLNVGSLAGGWQQIRFTAKGSLLDDEVDTEAALQVRLTSGGDAADGLVILNGATAATKAHASIEVLNPTTGDIRVTIKAAATDVVPPSDAAYWTVEDTRIGGTRVWRRTASSTVPPWYHFDAKVLKGSGSALPIEASAMGYIVAIEAATQTVV
jgi:hypothetical protein